MTMKMQQTYTLVRQRFNYVHRGEIEAKRKAKSDNIFCEGIKIIDYKRKFIPAYCFLIPRL